MSGPEPFADYYIALVADEEVVLLLGVSDEEVVLLLGDFKKKTYKRTKSSPALVEPLLIYKKENVFAKKSFPTRGIFDGFNKEHNIVVESSISGIKDTEMWISMDGVVLVHVKNLQWKFRGNLTVLVDKQPVQVMWDVLDWLFSSLGTGHGVFIFKPVIAESDKEGSDHGGGGDSDTRQLCHVIKDVGVCSIEQAELYAIYEGCKVAWNAGFRKIIVETNSTTDVKMIKDGIAKPNNNAIISGIVELQTWPWDIRSANIYGEANMLADHLLKIATRGSFITELSEHLPAQIIQTFTDDKLDKTSPRLVMATNLFAGS